MSKREPLHEAHMQLAYQYPFAAPGIKISRFARWAFLLTPKYLKKFSRFFLIAGLIMLLLAFLPTAWYEITGFNELSTEAKDVDFGSQQLRNLSYQPPLDTSLPLTNSIIINKIGVKAEIHEATRENHETALMNGVWRVDDFGTPAQRNRPTILVAHRFGYIWWSNQFRRENSFYNLDKIHVGDTIEVIWRQRKYTYAIYGEDEGEEISDYSGDLILYTCQDLTSKMKFFKYAKLVIN